MTDQAGNWLSLHAPEPLAAAREGATPAFSIGAGDATTVYCLTNIGGSGIAAALAADREVARLLEKRKARKEGTSAFEELVDKFKSSPLSGAATVTEMAFRRSKLNAVEASDPGNLAALNAYGDSINNAPFFSPNPARADENLESSRWGSLLGQVLGLLKPSSTTFAASWFDVAAEQIVFGISAFALDPQSNEVQLRTSAWTFLNEQWPSFAEKVAKVDVVTVDQWRKSLATPI